MDNLVTPTATFIGAPDEDGLLRKLINSFTHADRLYFIVRHFESGTSSTRLFTVCNNTAVYTTNQFVSVLEVVLTHCDSGYRYLVEARVTELQDGDSHLVLIYRVSEEAVESRLCAVSLSDVTNFIANNYNIINTAVPLAWPVPSETGATFFVTSVCDTLY